MWPFWVKPHLKVPPSTLGDGLGAENDNSMTADVKCEVEMTIVLKWISGEMGDEVESEKHQDRQCKRR